MFLAHYAVGLAAKRLAPQVSLGTLFLAAQFADLLWPILVMLGVEAFAVAPGNTTFTPLAFTHYPYSHSLLALAGWGVLFATAHGLARRVGMAASVMLAALVVSHWGLDALSHRPDMPLAFGDSPKVGLEVWRSLPLTLALEFAFLAVGVGVYARMTRARDRKGAWLLWGLVAFLVVISLANAFGPPPPSIAAVTWSAQALWLIVAWGYWIDRHRALR
jgi:hypothetical protein